MFLINGGAVASSTHKQLTVAFSSMESEYMALSDAARKALARRQLFEELCIPSASKPVTILTDSQTTLNISENPANYYHINIRCHAVRHYIRERKIEIGYIPSNYQPADIFTKVLGPSKHHRFCQMIGLRNSYEAFEDFELMKDIEEYDDE